MKYINFVRGDGDNYNQKSDIMSDTANSNSLKSKFEDPN